MSNDAVAYSYINVGVDAAEGPRTGVAYSMWSIVDRGARNFVGKVVGFATAPRISQVYAYINVGAWFPDIRDAVASVMWNQLEQVSGATRLLEDGAVRHLEDGTTERTLE